MPIEQITITKVSCDNPACPGNTLDPSTRTGWLFVAAEVYGNPTTQHVYCCADCVSADAAKLAAGPPPSEHPLGFIPNETTPELEGDPPVPKAAAAT